MRDVDIERGDGLPPDSVTRSPGLIKSRVIMAAYFKRVSKAWVLNSWAVTHARVAAILITCGVSSSARAARALIEQPSPLRTPAPLAPQDSAASAVALELQSGSPPPPPCRRTRTIHLRNRLPPLGRQPAKPLAPVVHAGASFSRRIKLASEASDD